ncbi:hypothetical protein J2T02_003596 [Chitinophaga terrae (ex Kim and Jung 2007)]|uniref:hypothetical protein n=1 Tax=Chitinophaga terrae (ex Kim and Jung 2007) TaxID=408074 RepID=UPI002781A767|nr:hypothetical protein [Chitinophaga terrae (ex Kim and Jung 2007)]MDQ0108463.1 hypothetical protein [Chitinophaga terrae (ex Kim and Jung 2007)]
MKEKLTCLLIDPDNDRRNQFYMALDLLGNSKACICHNNVQSAIQYLQEHPELQPDYIFMDAPANGSTLVPSFPEALNIRSLQTTPIVWYSTSYLASSEAALKLEGFTTGLTKQSNLLQLKAQLKNLFAQDFSIEIPESKPKLRLVKYEPAYSIAKA